MSWRLLSFFFSLVMEKLHIDFHKSSNLGHRIKCNKDSGTVSQNSQLMLHSIPWYLWVRRSFVGSKSFINLTVKEIRLLAFNDLQFFPLILSILMKVALVMYVDRPVLRSLIGLLVDHSNWCFSLLACLMKCLIFFSIMNDSFSLFHFGTILKLLLLISDLRLIGFTLSLSPSFANLSASSLPHIPV